MSLFGKSRDIGTFRNLNKELLNRIICQEIAYYKLSLNDTDANIYGESQNKVYYNPVKMTCLISRQPQVYEALEAGQIDYKREIRVGFLRDQMLDYKLVPEGGDVIQTDNEFFEIDTIVENQYYRGLNNYTELSIGDTGWDVSIIVICHSIKRSQINIQENRFGGNDSLQLPKDI